MHWGFTYLDAGMYVGIAVIGLQARKVGNGVVDALVAILAAARGRGAPALPVQQAACAALRHLARESVRVEGGREGEMEGRGTRDVLFFVFIFPRLSPRPICLELSMCTCGHVCVLRV